MFILPDVFFDVKKKGHNQVDNNGGSHGDKGGINKIKPDAAT